MEKEQTSNKDMKLEIASQGDMMSSGMDFPTSGPGLPGLTRQPSGAKGSCLCSPTTHAGSFRCRLHRSPSLRRTKSIDSASLRDTKANAATADAKTVEAQEYL